jgi:hypothetical protein
MLREVPDTKIILEPQTLDLLPKQEFPFISYPKLEVLEEK